jgi:hypothetical protein
LARAVIDTPRRDSAVGADCEMVLHSRGDRFSRTNCRWHLERLAPPKDFAVGPQREVTAITVRRDGDHIGGCGHIGLTERVVAPGDHTACRHVR